MFDKGEKLLKELYKLLGATNFDASHSRVQDTVALNTLPWYREEIVEISENQAGVAYGDGQLLTVRPLEVDAERPAVSVKQEGSTFVLENEQLRVVVDGGCITSLYDRIDKREVIEKGGKANRFVLFDDMPLYWEAWDVEVYHLETRRLLDYGPTRLWEKKPHRVVLETEVKISSKSSLKSYISLSAALGDCPTQVEFWAEVEWHENSKFLKVEFPVEVVSPEAAYETAFGLTRRPTHYNTSWDMAKFEVCCHRFADLSEHDYGVSILNQGKYGFATAGRMMRLSLLRAPKAPDAHADMGHHSIRWAMLPHRGPLSATTVRAAHGFNNPLRLLSMAPATAREAPVQLLPLDRARSLVLDTIKRGHDDVDVSRHEGLRLRKGRSLIVRVYESLGAQARGLVRSKLPLVRVSKTNILEDDLETIGHADNQFAIQLRPFEVATYRLEL